MNSSFLPTGTFNSWTITSLRDSLASELSTTATSTNLKMFFYAATQSGWTEIRKPVLNWKEAKPLRTVTLFAGTDHAITDPQALWAMKQSGVDVRIMETYRGVFHPKVVWLADKDVNLIWVGSNNLTRDGLVNNVECSVLIRARTVPNDFIRWVQEIESGSCVLSESLLKSYKEEREDFEKRQTKASAAVFTWSKKKEPKSSKGISARSGDLILEIMPEETRGGNQIQIPKEAAKDFFGLSEIGEQKEIILQPFGTTQRRRLIITVFENNTVRLSINELEYGDRPCVVIFQKTTGSHIVFEIVPQNIFPTRYKDLLRKCTRQTRRGSRRWGII